MYAGAYVVTLMLEVIVLGSQNWIPPSWRFRQPPHGYANGVRLKVIVYVSYIRKFKAAFRIAFCFVAKFSNSNNFSHGFKL